MPTKTLQIQSIVNILIRIAEKVAEKIDPSVDEVTEAVLRDAISVNDLEKLKETVDMYDNIDDCGRRLLFVQLVSTIMENTNRDLDRRNVAALIHLKVTLLKLLGYTISIVLIVTITGSFFTDGVDLGNTLKSLYGVIEVMFLK